MKLFLCSVNADGSPHVVCDLDHALAIIRQVDNITAGVPKILYVVGWQYNGHDDKYPAFFEVNKALKRPQDADARQSLLWLVREAKKYHTTISLHINMTDAYRNSPLWDEYVRHDLISRNQDGSLMVTGHYNNRDAYQVNYKNEWESGYAQKRIDRLIAYLPFLKEAGTIHLDSWLPRESKGHSESEIVEADYQLKIGRYWMSKGIDVTSEWGLDFMRGLVPYTWMVFNSAAKSELTQQDFLTVPANVYTGGRMFYYTKNADTGLAFLFGTSLHGEELFRQADWTPLFAQQFYLNSLQYFFLNSHKRLGVKGDGNDRIALYTGNVRVFLADSSVTRNGAVLRKKETVFFPAAWLGKGYYIYYSLDRVGEITLPVPDEWKEAGQVKVRQITPDGRIDREDIGIHGNAFTLRASPGEALLMSIVPRAR